MPQTTVITERADLRNSPIYRNHADHWDYVRPLPSANKLTYALDIGTQQKFIDAAWEAYSRGQPLNALLTVHWSDVEFVEPDDSICYKIAKLVEKIRKWMVRHGLEVHYIWAREATDSLGEHWHFTLHLPCDKRMAFLEFVGKVLDDPLGSGKRQALDKSRGEIARSASGGWHLAGDALHNRKFPGYFLAAYCGKGEPSERLFRGKLVPNKQKPERGREFEGVAYSSRYDAAQGLIEGTTKRKKRYDISRALKTAIQTGKGVGFRTPGCSLSNTPPPG